MANYDVKVGYYYMPYVPAFVVLYELGEPLTSYVVSAVDARPRELQDKLALARARGAYHNDRYGHGIFEARGIKDGFDYRLQAVHAYQLAV
jgi:hypothetical protein